MKFIENAKLFRWDRKIDVGSILISFLAQVQELSSSKPGDERTFSEANTDRALSRVSHIALMAK